MKSKIEDAKKSTAKKATVKKTVVRTVSPSEVPTSASATAEPDRKPGRPKNTTAGTRTVAPEMVARKPGRPSNPAKQSVTERTKDFDKSIVLRGGRILNRVRLEEPSNQALAALKEFYGTDRLAIETALVEHAKKVGKYS